MLEVAPGLGHCPIIIATLALRGDGVCGLPLTLSFSVVTPVRSVNATSPCVLSLSPVRTPSPHQVCLKTQATNPRMGSVLWVGLGLPGVVLCGMSQQVVRE